MFSDTIYSTDRAHGAGYGLITGAGFGEGGSFIYEPSYGVPFGYGDGPGNGDGSGRGYGYCFGMGYGFSHNYVEMKKVCLPISH
jgi:hypothetical protein